MQYLWDCWQWYGHDWWINQELKTLAKNVLWHSFWRQQYSPDSARNAMRDWFALGRGNHPVVAGTTCGEVKVSFVLQKYCHPWDLTQTFQIEDFQWQGEENILWVESGTATPQPVNIFNKINKTDIQQFGFNSCKVLSGCYVEASKSSAATSQSPNIFNISKLTKRGKLS